MLLKEKEELASGGWKAGGCMLGAQAQEHVSMLCFLPGRRLTWLLKGQRVFSAMQSLYLPWEEFHRIFPLLESYQETKFMASSLRVGVMLPGTYPLIASMSQSANQIPKVWMFPLYRSSQPRNCLIGNRKSIFAWSKHLLNTRYLPRMMLSAYSIPSHRIIIIRNSQMKEISLLSFYR